MRTPRDVEPLVSDLELHGGRLILWPETRRRLAARLRRRPTPIGRPATRHQRWGADIAADLRLDALIAAAEAGGIIEVRDAGALQIISLARPAARAEAPASRNGHDTDGAGRGGAGRKRAAAAKKWPTWRGA